jgi:hypothetical protein
MPNAVALRASPSGPKLTPDLEPRFKPGLALIPRATTSARVNPGVIPVNPTQNLSTTSANTMDNIVPVMENPELPFQDFNAQRLIDHHQQIVADFLDDDNVSPDLKSDDSDDLNTKQKARRPNKERSHIENHERLMANYLNENLTYNANDFRQRFQMDQTIFLRILDDLTDLYPYFVQKPVCFFSNFSFISGSFSS